MTIGLSFNSNQVYFSSVQTAHAVGSGKLVQVDVWHVLHAGTVENHPYGTIPEIDIIEGAPFTFERETLEFGHPWKSAFVSYWANGRYWEFWTADQEEENHDQHR